MFRDVNVGLFRLWNVAWSGFLVSVPFILVKYELSAIGVWKCQSDGRRPFPSKFHDKFTIDCWGYTFCWHPAGWLPNTPWHILEWKVQPFEDCTQTKHLQFNTPIQCFTHTTNSWTLMITVIILLPDPTWKYRHRYILHSNNDPLDWSSNGNALRTCLGLMDYWLLWCQVCWPVESCCWSKQVWERPVFLLSDPSDLNHRTVGRLKEECCWSLDHGRRSILLESTSLSTAHT